MPGDVISINTFDEVTIEAWYTPSEGASGGFTMLASFGLTNPDADWMGVDYFIMTSTRGDDVSRAAISIGNYSDSWATDLLSTALNMMMGFCITWLQRLLPLKLLFTLMAY